MYRSYHERWHRSDSRPIGAISEDAAAARYRLRQPFCIVVHDDWRVVGFVEFGGDSFGVGFLDEQGRVKLEYSFDEVDGQLFLSQAFCFDYQADDSGTQTNHYFQTSGATAIERIGSRATSGTVSEGTVDVSGNWERLPEFEGIDGLLRAERPMPEGPS